jgi:hypothetical protein
MAAGDRPDRFAPARESPPPHRLTVPEPVEIGLPHARRGYVVPILIALAVFALIVLVRFLWD